MTTVPLWASIPASILLIISGVLTLIGSAGLLRFKRFYSRMHAPTLGNTLGVAAVLLASILVSSALVGRPVLHQILITFFLIITSPVTAMLLMQAAISRDPRRPVDDDD
ncbi:MAG TPA: monovalent cation/H(+) antiporter subunit G [Eoetvoesiella sp.]